MKTLKLSKTDLETFADLANSKSGATVETHEDGTHYLIYKGIKMYTISQKLFDFLKKNNIIELD